MRLQKLDPDSAKELMEKAAYLNGDDKWVVPFYLSRRFPSEQIAAMNVAVVNVLSEQIDALLPLIRFLTNKSKTTKRKSSASKQEKRKRLLLKRRAQLQLVPLRKMGLHTYQKLSHWHCVKVLSI